MYVFFTSSEMGRKRKSVTLAERGSAKLAKVSTDTDEHARSHSTAPTTVVQHEGRDASLKPSSTVRLHAIQDLSLSCLSLDLINLEWSLDNVN